MRILIMYGSTEGHTRELSEFIANCLRRDGQDVIVRDAGGKDQVPDPHLYDAVFLAASLHVGRYQAPLIEFARAHHAVLNAKPSAFISVSLSAAGENPDDWEGLDQCVARFLNETMWKPAALYHAAGAIRYSQYDFFKRLAIKFIAARHGQHTVTSRDYDLTDYDALQGFVLEFVKSAASAGRLPGVRPES